jgi:O-antigen/teichoic acid export membrane protein
MIKLQHIRATVKNRFGELWWYTTILFVTQQLGSIINAFIGLWLVPQYVPTEELGAVLPLMKVGGFIMLPIGILIMPYKKFINKFATNNEWGKVKQLILDMFAISIVLTLAAFLYAHFFMPFIFERLRVADGMLGLLIIFSGIITAILPIFVTILEALKQFKLISIAGLVCAPTRLL